MNGVKLGLLAMLAALPVWGCSFGCIGEPEVRNGFTVDARFQGRPLEGASVELTDDRQVRTFETGPDGKAIVKVPQGKYSLTVRKFGAVIGSECGIRVSELSGKELFTYEWKDTPEPVARIAGRLSHQLDTGEMAPLPNWKMILHALDGPQRQATVATDGTFDFGALPAGLYVLEASAADEPRPVPLRLDPEAKRRDLDLIYARGYCFPGGMLFRDWLDAFPQ